MSAIQPIEKPGIPDTTPASPSARRLRFWGAAGLAVAVVLGFYLQVAWGQSLMTPWYLPIGGTLAALTMLSALPSRRGWGRVLVSILATVLAILEWVFVLLISSLPGYAGPVLEGSRVPPFHAQLADGTPIDQSHFQQDRATVVVFFQGRWCPFCITQLRELETHHANFERVGVKVAVVSIEDVATAAETQRDFPHLVVISDAQRELAHAVDLINKGFAPDGSDCAIPTILIVDQQGIVKWVHRPARFISRPSSAELIAKIAQVIP